MVSHWLHVVGCLLWGSPLWFVDIGARWRDDLGRERMRESSRFGSSSLGRSVLDALHAPSNLNVRG